MNIDVVGGTYFEECFEPHWSEIYGSGLRGALVIADLDKSANVHLHTFGNKEVVDHLSYLESVFRQLKSTVVPIDESLTFKYDHPLAEPLIYPRLDTIKRNEIFVEAENIILFGTLDGSASVRGKRVVYDPQSPVNPVPFKQTSSTADKLVVIANLSEARFYSQKENLLEIKESLFESEKPEALIIKDGPKGAYVFTRDGAQITVPAYKTQSVWSIGSGDVFSASFTYHWILKSLSVQEAAEQASYNTAQYCNSRQLMFSTNDSFESIKISGKAAIKQCVYLAGPFFTFSQRWLIQQFRTALVEMGINVFSPWHDVGFGSANEVVPLDIQAINKANVLLAVVDGLDSGTLFEIGYARAKGIPVVAYVQNEPSDALKMLEGTGCAIFEDLTAAIYNTAWSLLAHE